MAVELGVPGVEDAIEIGRAGFAVVYRATQPAAARTVAVKVLSASVDADWEQRFARECQALGQLSAHPNIVTLLGSGITDGGQGYLILEYCPGGSLASRLQSSGRLGWLEATGITTKLAGALATAHRRGVLHRDLKPENVLMTEYGEPALGDFGIARLSGGWQTSSQVIVASLAHAAPEVLNGQASSPGSDVWSLGSTLCQLLVGHPPFARQGDTPGVMVARILRGVAPQLGASVPDSLRPILGATLNADPEQRPSAEELQEQLHRALSGDGLGAALPPLGDATVWTPAAGAVPGRPPPPPNPPGVAAAAASGPPLAPPSGSVASGGLPPPPPPPTPLPAAGGHHRRRRGLILAAVVLAAVLLSGTAVFLLTRSSSNDAVRTADSSDTASDSSSGTRVIAAPRTPPTVPSTLPSTLPPTTTTPTTGTTPTINPGRLTLCVNDRDPAPATMRSAPNGNATPVVSLAVGTCTIQDAGSGAPQLAVDPATGLAWRQVVEVNRNQLGWVPDEDLKGASGAQKESPADCSYSPLRPGQVYREVESLSTGSHQVLICSNARDGSLVYRGVDVTQTPPLYITLPARVIPGGYEATVKEFRYEVVDHLRVFQGGNLILDEPITGG